MWQVHLEMYSSPSVLLCCGAATVERVQSDQMTDCVRVVTACSTERTVGYSSVSMKCYALHMFYRICILKRNKF